MRNRSFVFVKWQHGTDGFFCNLQLHILAGSLDLKFPLTLQGQKPPYYTICHWTLQGYRTNDI